MKVYQIIINGEEGQTFPGDLYWSKEKAIEVMIKLESDIGDFGYITIKEKEIKE